MFVKKLRLSEALRNFRMLGGFLVGNVSVLSFVSFYQEKEKEGIVYFHLSC